MSPQTPTLLTSSIGVAGTLIGALSGVFLGHILSVHSTRRQSVRESKKQEYRSLLDTLGNSVREIKEAKNFVHFPPESAASNSARDLMYEMKRHKAEMTLVNERTTSALLAASQSFDDRLFIEEPLTKHNVRGDWRAIEELAMLPGAGQQKSDKQKAFDTAEFSEKWTELTKKISRIAKEDCV
jgi:hypothetical protein